MGMEFFFFSARLRCIRCYLPDVCYSAVTSCFGHVPQVKVKLVTSESGSRGFQCFFPRVCSVECLKPEAQTHKLPLFGQVSYVLVW